MKPDQISLGATPFWQREKLYVLLACVAVLLVGIYALTKSSNGPMANLFDLNGEANVPTWYSSMLWVLAGLSAYRVARSDDRQFALYWLLLAIGCALLSLDEAAQFHEMFGGMLDRRVGDLTGGVVPVYRWVRVAIVLVILSALFFLRFLLRLERRTALRLVGAGAIFLLGAIGVESLGSLVEAKVISGFPPGLTWGRSIALEEFLEMMGSILMLRACDLYARREQKEWLPGPDSNRRPFD